MTRISGLAKRLAHLGYPDREGQNRSSAVMQRRTSPRKKTLDDFPTPPWAARALCEILVQRYGMDLKALSVREPAANRGFMARALGEYFGRVLASDVQDYGAGFPVFDYLRGIGPLEETDWTITNPPYVLAEDFLDRAMRESRAGVALLLRIAFLEGLGRYERVFRDRRPDCVLQFSERVVIHEARLVADGSTATAYAWFVWPKEPSLRTEIDWIPPCRQDLEDPSDYPGYRLEVSASGRRKWRRTDVDTASSR